MFYLKLNRKCWGQTKLYNAQNRITLSMTDLHRYFTLNYIYWGFDCLLGLPLSQAVKNANFKGSTVMEIVLIVHRYMLDLYPFYTNGLLYVNASQNTNNIEIKEINGMVEVRSPAAIYLLTMEIPEQCVKSVHRATSLTSFWCLYF